MRKTICYSCATPTDGKCETGTHAACDAHKEDCCLKFIYVMRDPNDHIPNHRKVGMAHLVGKRLKAFQTSSPGLAVEYRTPNRVLFKDGVVHDTLESKFPGSRIEGEWFELPLKDICQTIEELCPSAHKRASDNQGLVPMDEAKDESNESDEDEDEAKDVNEENDFPFWYSYLPVISKEAIEFSKTITADLFFRVVLCERLEVAEKWASVQNFLRGGGNHYFFDTSNRPCMLKDGQPDIHEHYLKFFDLFEGKLFRGGRRYYDQYRGKLRGKRVKCGEREINGPFVYIFWGDPIVYDENHFYTKFGFSVRIYADYVTIDGSEVSDQRIREHLKDIDQNSGAVSVVLDSKIELWLSEFHEILERIKPRIYGPPSKKGKEKMATKH